jgi:hypothetical protein
LLIFHRFLEAEKNRAVPFDIFLRHAQSAKGAEVIAKITAWRACQMACAKR